MPLPYFSSPRVLTAVASYFASPSPAGAAAVNTSLQRLQRRRSRSYTVAASGA